MTTTRQEQTIQQAEGLCWMTQQNGIGDGRKWWWWRERIKRGGVSSSLVDVYKRKRESPT